MAQVSENVWLAIISAWDLNLPFFNVSLIVEFVQFLAKLIQKFLQTLLLSASLSNTIKIQFLIRRA